MSSRLVVLQTKRHLLTDALARESVKATDQAGVDVERLERAVRTAHRRYREAVLQFASPHSDQYILVAYGSLIAKAEFLQAKLRTASDELGGPDSSQLRIEAIALESIIGGWRAVARRSMAPAVA